MKTRNWVLGPLAALALVGCGTKYPAAGVTLGAGVTFAGVHRATSGGCWADCRTGQRCDPDTGTCVALPCGGSCGPDERCAPSSTGESCVRAARDRMSATAEPASAEPGADAGADACAEPCAEPDPCVVDAGTSDCGNPAATP